MTFISVESSRRRRIPPDYGKLVIFAALMCAIVISSAAWAADGDDIVGVWFSEHRHGKIQVFNCGDKYCGKIVWMSEPNYTAENKEGKPGERKRDVRNPDPALRKRTIVGMQILSDFRYAGNNSWTGGKIYDPDSGKFYSARISLSSPDKLLFRGYLWIPLLGRTSTWTRVTGE